MRTRTFADTYSLQLPISFRNMVDMEVDDFHLRRSQGELFCNPMTSASGFKSRRDPTSWYYMTHYRVSTLLPWTISGPYSRSVPLSNPVFLLSGSWPTAVPGRASSVITELCGSDVEEALVEQAHTKIAANLTAGVASLLVTLAEGNKTLGMISKAVALLRQPFTEARKLLKISRSAYENQPGARKKVKELAGNMWLEGRYGWRPFIFDIMSIGEASVKKTNTRFTERAIAGSKTGENSYWATVDSAGKASVGCKIELTARLMTRCGQTADLQCWLNGDLKKWGFLDPVGTAWDLVPLSFVVDWFVNLGDVLKSFQAYALFGERIGWSTRIASVTAVHTLGVKAIGGLQNQNLGYFFHSFADPNWTYREIVMLKNRMVVESFLPTMGLRMNLNVSKVVDLIALFDKIVLSRR